MLKNTKLDKLYQRKHNVRHLLLFTLKTVNFAQTRIPQFCFSKKTKQSTKFFINIKNFAGFLRYLARVL